MIRSRFSIKMDVLTWGYLQSLMYKMDHIEFSAFLLGSVSEDGYSFVIEDYYVPTQKVRAVKVDVIEELFTIPKETRSRIVGYVHSHHIMGASPSGTDFEHLNHPLHIIIAHGGQYSTIIRKKTECGKWIILENIPIEFFGTYADEEEIQKIEVMEQPTFNNYTTANDPEDLKECENCGFDLNPDTQIEYEGKLFCDQECIEDYKTDSMGMKQYWTEKESRNIEKREDIEDGMIF